jgi:hypothetical protein
MFKKMKLAAAFVAALGASSMAATPVEAQNNGATVLTGSVAVTFNDRSSPLFHDLTHNGVVEVTRIQAQSFRSMQACRNHVETAYRTAVSRLPSYERSYRQIFGRNVSGTFGISVRARCINTGGQGFIENRNYNTPFSSR